MKVIRPTNPAHPHFHKEKSVTKSFDYGGHSWIAIIDDNAHVAKLATQFLSSRQGGLNAVEFEALSKLPNLMLVKKVVKETDQKSRRLPDAPPQRRRSPDYRSIAPRHYFIQRHIRID